tara:strand:+ start:153 stop:737 length:585 start_codon:yes stop_codon:yes gene_type:complete
MARTREFDPDQALDKAMHLFWERGFQHTSMEDLVKHTGVSRYGLYGTFGNKDAIYRQALIRYIQSLKDDMRKELRKPSAGRAELEAYFHQITGYLCSDEGRKGCMVYNTAVELAPHHPDIAEYLRGLQNDMRLIVAQVLRNGQQAGEVRTDIDADELAMMLFAMEQGMAALHRGGWPFDKLMPCYETFLKVLDG